MNCHGYASSLSQAVLKVYSTVGNMYGCLHACTHTHTHTYLKENFASGGSFFSGKLEKNTCRKPQFAFKFPMKH